MKTLSNKQLKKENRKKQAERVRKYFEESPEAKEILSEISKRQWDNTDLKEWRAQKTKEQWTDEFRKKRKEAYDKTYFKHTMAFMKNLLETQDSLEDYEKARAMKRNTNLLKNHASTSQTAG